MDFNSILIFSIIYLTGVILCFIVAVKSMLMENIYETWRKVDESSIKNAAILSLLSWVGLFSVMIVYSHTYFSCFVSFLKNGKMGKILDKIIG